MELRLTATGCRLPYVITCQLPPDTSESRSKLIQTNPAITPAKQVGTRFIYPEGIEG